MNQTEDLPGQIFSHEISVLVTPTKSGGSLTTLLGSLLRDYQPGIRAQLVVVVPENQKSDALYQKLRKIKNQGIALKVIPVDDQRPMDVPQWRAMAFRAATGRTAVFLEDNAIVEPGWWQGWLGCVERGDWSIATGLVRPDLERLTRVGVGVFFCEYGPFIPASASGVLRPLKRVSGNHWAVRRDKIAYDPAETSIDEFEWVKQNCHFLHKPHWNHNAGVKCNREIGLKEAFLERARQGFHFGRVEAIHSGWLRRLKMVHAGPGILVVQMARLCYVIAQRRSQTGVFLKHLPWTFFLIKTWSLAEWAGWGAGSVSSLVNRKPKHGAKKAGQAAKQPAIAKAEIIKPDQARVPGIPEPHLGGRNAEVNSGTKAQQALPH